VATRDSSLLHELNVNAANPIPIQINCVFFMFE
jgi:hypothetical protein